MLNEVLESVLDATVEAGLPRGRLDQFAAERDLPRALVLWLGLERGAPIPGKREILEELERDVAAIDGLLGRQLDAILHHASFQVLEASWRGLHLLCDAVQDRSSVKIRILDLTWRELARDLDRAIEFDQSQLFRRVYSDEFDLPGGEPFGVLLGDFRVAHRPRPGHPIDDVATLAGIGAVAAAAFAPFLTAPEPALFGLNDFAELGRPIDLKRVFAQAEYTKWNALRRAPDSRFLGLVLPRVLMRPPWRSRPERSDGFCYEEDCSASGSQGYLWGSPLYAYGCVLVRAFEESGWLADLRGVERDVEGGGLITSITSLPFDSDPRSGIVRGAAEVAISDSREKELADQGYIGLCHCHGTGLLAAYSVPSLQIPVEFDRAAAQHNSRLSTLLHHLFCASRFAHYLKVMARDKIGLYNTEGQLEEMLNEWLRAYTDASEDASSELRARYPLREAYARVRQATGKPGTYLSEIHLRPHFQFDDVGASLRLVTEIHAGAER